VDEVDKANLKVSLSVAVMALVTSLSRSSNRGSFYEPDRGPAQGSGYWLNWTDGPVQRSPFLEHIERV
jgi:hypothetical protein